VFLVASAVLVLFVTFLLFLLLPLQLQHKVALHVQFLCLSLSRVMLLTQLSYIYEGVSKSVRTGRLDRELQMVQLSATMCSCTAIL
jgi:hypothetical protein